MLRVNVTYEVITPESAEQGDAEERGFEVEGESWTFREVVEWLRDHSCEASCWPCRVEDVLRGGIWAYELEGEPDHQTMETRTLALHLDEDSPRARRYWAKAFRAAGLIRA